MLQLLHLAVNVTFYLHAVFAVRTCEFGEHALCFYDPVFKHIDIVGLLPPQLENRAREKEHALGARKRESKCD